MKKPINFLFTVFICLLMANLAFAQDEEAELNSEVEGSDRPIEEITVQGTRTFHALRLEIESAENVLYALFNDLNNNDDFDVECRMTVFTGSRIPVRDCIAEYFREAIGDNAAKWVRGEDVMMTRDQILSTLSAENAEMEKEMIRIANENADFFEALARLTILNAEYINRKKENPFFFEN